MPVINKYLLLILFLAMLGTGCASSNMPNTASSSAQLAVGKSWNLIAFGEGSASVMDDAAITITFSDNGRITGSAGCNRYFGNYELREDRLTLSQIGTTRMACPSPVMEQENRFLSALDAVQSWEREGDRLELEDADGEPLLSFATVIGAPLSGEVYYRPRIALPPDAIVHIRLLDVSRADAPALTLAEQTIHTEGRQVPIPFLLSYDASQIEPSHRYAVRAEIRDGEGKLMWTSDTTHPVITQNAPTDKLSIEVVQVLAENDRARSLVGSTWHLVLIEKGDGTSVTPEAGEHYTITFGADARYHGQADCNRYGGEYEIEDNGEVELDRGLSTLAACPPPSSSAAFFDVLAEVEQYAVAGDRLTLGGGAGDLEFEQSGGTLVGPEWRLTELRTAEGDNITPDSDEPYTIAFAASGRFAGQADCNRYMGTYDAKPGGDLSLSDAATTFAACAPGSSAPAFFAVLNRVDGFSVSGARLTLRASDTGTLVFERATDFGGMPPQKTGQDYAYTCDSQDGSFTFRIRTGPGEIALWLPERFEGREGGTYRVLGQVRAASGAKYQDGPVMVWTKGLDEALLEVDGETYRGCARQFD